MGATLDVSNAEYIATLNFSYVLDLMIILIFIILSMIFIVILYNAFLITINERRKEYAILNSIGAIEIQVSKMVLLEATIIGIIGIIIGFFISTLGANIILKELNSIMPTYEFKLVISIKYIILSIAILIFNIYLSAIIPSMKAGSTSIIQDIRNNKQIKYKKKINIFEKIFPIEAKIAIKNFKRNKSKYKIIVVLLIVCMTSYIAISTYVRYEKEAADLINEHDVDMAMLVDTIFYNDIQNIIKWYSEKFDDKIEYMEYKKMSPYIIVEAKNVVLNDVDYSKFYDNKKNIIFHVNIIGLDDKTYSKYINKINAKDGDGIIYNNVTNWEITDKEVKYISHPVFKKDEDIKFNIVRTKTNHYNNESGYEIIENASLSNAEFVLTDEIIISIILSIPIIYKIIKHMENIIKLSKILIPFENICIFFVILFIITILIILYSTKYIEE